MVAKLLNSFYQFEGSYQGGDWTINRENSLVVTPPRTVRLHSTSVSGGTVLLNNSSGGQPLTADGGPEVWVRIRDINNVSKYLSAPLSTAIDFPNVNEIVLGVTTIIGNPACSDVYYVGLVNAHLIYELL